MFDSLFSWLLLPACAVLGWALGRRAGRLAPAVQTHRNEAIANLGTLVRDDADEAIAALSRAVEAEPGAIELQLTLGSLFRKRGEIDRAIRVHESLLEHTGLSAEQTAQGRLELAQDYLKAGVIDRAEDLAQSLLDSGLQAAPVLELLLDLYEQTRDWPQAIATLRRWQSVRGRSAATRMAQYHCELAEAARAGGDLAAALRCAQDALEADPGCVRASIILGATREKQGEPARALEHYVRVLEQAPVFLSEVLPALQRCAEAAGDRRIVGELLDEAERLPEMPGALVLAKARWLASSGGPALGYLTTRLAQRPDWEALVLWIELSGAAAAAGADWPALQAALRKRVAMQPRFACGQCGFKPSVLFWQCPSCKSWATVRPAAMA